MEHYCTLFDSNYLTRGLALYRSLVKSGDSFHLHIFAFDDLTTKVLKEYNLKHATVITLPEFETEELLSVKKERTPVEFCWTSTPHVIRHILDNNDIDRGTYLDADLYFFNKPSIIMDEFTESNKSILLTEHRYTPKYDNTERVGVYNVQFMTFNKDNAGLSALQWWQDRCIEWCYNRFEDGKMGDQKYLDDWATRFQGSVHVLQHQGGGLAPWNIQQYDLVEEKIQGGAEFSTSSVRVSNISTQEVFPVIFYHFHGLKLFNDGLVQLHNNELPKELKKRLYYPYIGELVDLTREIKEKGYHFDPNATVDVSKFRFWKYHSLKGRFTANIESIKKIAR